MDFIILTIILLIGVYFFREAVTMVGWLLASLINFLSFIIRKIKGTSS